MKKILFYFIFTLIQFLFLNIFSKEVIAAVSCPHTEIDCMDLDNQGGCESPCDRVVVRTGGKNINARCVCKDQNTYEPTGSLSCGTKCSKDSECSEECPACTSIGFNSEPVCADHEWKPGDSIPDTTITIKAQLCEDETKIHTALGCVPKTIEGFIPWLFSYALSIAGGFAFILMAIGAIQLITSAGDPEKVKKGQERITNAVAGLLFIIFAVFILKVIGVNMLQIPGFG